MHTTDITNEINPPTSKEGESDNSTDVSGSGSAKLNINSLFVGSIFLLYLCNFMIA